MICSEVMVANEGVGISYWKSQTIELQLSSFAFSNNQIIKAMLGEINMTKLPIRESELQHRQECAVNSLLFHLISTFRI